MTKIVKHETNNNGDNQILPYHIDLFETELNKYENFNDFCINVGVASPDEYGGGNSLKIKVSPILTERITDPITGLWCYNNLHGLYSRLWQESEIRNARKISYHKHLSKEYPEAIDQRIEKMKEIGELLKTLRI